MTTPTMQAAVAWTRRAPPLPMRRYQGLDALKASTAPTTVNRKRTSAVKVAATDPMPLSWMGPWTMLRSTTTTASR